MEFTTESRDLGVRQFYDLYKGRLPKIVMVNQGFYDDMGNDTFSREQILRLHTTVRSKRVFIHSYVGRVRKSYSMSINYPEKFAVIDDYGNTGIGQSLHAIVRDNVLPVHVRLAPGRTIMMNNQHVQTSNLPDMELIQTFDEISFLGNDIDKGVMSTEVLKLQICLENVRFKIVTGIVGQSKRRWLDFNNKLNSESKSISYSEKLGLEEIAQYRQSQVIENVEISMLEPVLYTNMATLFATRPLTESTTPQTQYSTRVESRDQDDTYEIFENVKKETDQTGTKAALWKDITTAVVQKGKNIKKTFLKPKQTTGKPEICPKPIRVIDTYDDVKPKTAPKPSKTRTYGDTREGIGSQTPSKDVKFGTMPKVQGSKQSFHKSRSSKQATETLYVKYDPELDYDTAVDRSAAIDRSVTVNPSTYYNQTQIEESLYTQTYVDETVHSSYNSNYTKRSDGIYTNTEQLAIISPLSRSESKPQSENIYANTSDITDRASHRPSTRTTDRTVIQQPTKDQSVKQNKLSPSEIAELTIDDVAKYLKLLKLEVAVEGFRENQVDGKLLTLLDADLLKGEFKLNPLQILKLQNFIKDGHIPQ